MNTYKVPVPWLRWFEGRCGPAYYAEEYSSGVLKFLFGDFENMLTAINVSAALFTIISAALIIAHAVKKRDKLLE